MNVFSFLKSKLFSGTKNSKLFFGTKSVLLLFLIFLLSIGVILFSGCNNSGLPSDICGDGVCSQFESNITCPSDCLNDVVGDVPEVPPVSVEGDENIIVFSSINVSSKKDFFEMLNSSDQNQKKLIGEVVIIPAEMDVNMFDVVNYFVLTSSDELLLAVESKVESWRAGNISDIPAGVEFDLNDYFSSKRVALYVLAQQNNSEATKLVELSNSIAKNAINYYSFFPAYCNIGFRGLERERISCLMVSNFCILKRYSFLFGDLAEITNPVGILSNFDCLNFTYPEFDFLENP